MSGSARVGAFDQLAVLRYTTGGALDASFSSDGMATWAFGSGSSVGRAVLALPDGTIAVVGDAVVGGSQDVAVARIQGSGALEGGFGTGGLRTVAVRADSDLARDIALGADGELVVAGQSWAPGAALDAAVLTFASARIDQYAGGSRDWTSGAFFGACLRSAGSAVADWGHRVDDTCPTSHGSWWRAVPATATPVAHTTGIGTTTLALRFGVRADAAQARGRYVAPLAFTVIAPG